MKKIAVLMTCFNRVNTTLACLARLFAQKLPEGCALEVWLVDDASPDKTGEMVKAAYPQVNVIQSPGNLFWCKGMRLAWESALRHFDYDAYLWLNDDVKLFEGAILGVLEDAAKTRYEGIVIGAFAHDETGSVVAYGVAEKGGKVRPIGEPLKTRGAMGGNLVFVPRAAFAKVGLIYGGYGHGFGDYDYGWMADRAGVPRYLGSKICGVCPQQPERYNQKLSSLSLLGRLKLLFDPKGFPLVDSIKYRFRKDGIARAVVSACHIVLKVIVGKV